MQQFLFVVFLIFVGQIIGSLVGLVKRPSRSLIHHLLAFAGAMMLGVSFLQLIPQAIAIAPYAYVIAGFVFGALAMIAVDKTLPHINPELGKKETPNVRRSVAMLVIGIGLHNLPEGLAIGIGFAVDPGFGLLIALSIAIQDIPENMATIIPLYALTGKKLKSFAILVGTIIFEAVGFVFGFFVLNNMPAAILSVSLAAAAGIMSYIAVEELLPGAELGQQPYRKAAAMVLAVAIVLLMMLLF